MKKTSCLSSTQNDAYFFSSTRWPNLCLSLRPVFLPTFLSLPLKMPENGQLQTKELPTPSLAFFVFFYRQKEASSCGYNIWSVGGKNQLALGARLGLACRAWARGDVRGWYRWASRQKTRGRVTRWAARQPSMHEELVARGCSFPAWRVAGMHGLLWCGEQCRWRGCLRGMNQLSEGPARVAVARWSL